jgi:putative oxidoreductase
LTEKGSIAALNSGIEFATTYFILLLSLLFSGAGRYLSLDYFIDRSARQYLKPKAVESDVEAKVESAMTPEPESAPPVKPREKQAVTVADE